MAEEITRRDFIRKGMRAAIGAALAASLPWPSEVKAQVIKTPDKTKEKWQPLPGNPNIGLVNGVFLEGPAGQILSRVPFNWEAMYRQGGKLNLEGDGQSDLWGYGEKVRQGLKNGQEIFAAVVTGNELVRGEASLVEWENYLRAIVETYHFPGYLIGNELNINETWQGKIEEYAGFYLKSRELVKKIDPLALVLPFADAYFGQGEMMKKVLETIKEKGGQIDGLAFHFYDSKPLLLPERTELYRKILEETGWADRPLFLTEAGWPDKEPLKSESDYADFVSQLVAIMACLIKEGKLEKGLFFAGLDPTKPKMSLVRKEPDRTTFRSAFLAFARSRAMTADEAKLLVNQLASK